MAEAVDHWQALFDHNYLRWFDLQGKPALVEIVKVEPRVELTLPGGAKSRKPVVTLKQVKGDIDGIKPLVLNSTNGCAIADVHGDKPSQWVGKQVVLYEAKTKLWNKDLGKMVEVPCIRIRAAKTRQE